MTEMAFSKWSPGGNTTLFFDAQAASPEDRAKVARAALPSEQLGGEQVGFVNERKRSLHMAGGEFCLNATRAFGALLDWKDSQGPRDRNAPRTFTISVSGWPTKILTLVSGQPPVWKVTAELALPDCPMRQVDENVCMVRLPGIVHLLFDGARRPFPDDGPGAMQDLRRAYALEEEACVGGIWWSLRQGRVEMLPLIHVRDAGTTILENACGSGALALSLHLAEKSRESRFSLLQPGGSTLEVVLLGTGPQRMARVSGPVALVSAGSFWLPQETAR